jgi:predicted kinase
MQVEPAAAPAGPDPRYAVVVSGPPASGKTTFAVRLAAATGYALFDLDMVTGPLTRAALRLSGQGEEGVDTEVGAALRDARYQSLLGAAAANRAIGLGVVVAAPFTKERADPDAWAEATRRLGGVGGPVVLVYLDCPPEVLAARLAARAARRDRLKATAGVVAVGVEAAPPAWADIVVSATMSVDDQVAVGLTALGLPPRRSE